MIQQDKKKPLLEVKNLSVFLEKSHLFELVRNVSFSVSKGETLAIIGASGAGKTTLVLSMLKLLSHVPSLGVKGEVIYKGKNLLEIPEVDLETIRRREISVIFQDPIASLNPGLTIKNQLFELIKLHNQNADSSEVKKRAVKLLTTVEVNQIEEKLSQHPHQLSTGQAQRINIAMALSNNPSLLIADEPVSSLDAINQTQIIKLIQKLKIKLNLSVIFISHDLSVISRIADRVAVMNQGSIVELSNLTSLLKHQKHQLTKNLVQSAKKFEIKRK